MKRFFACLMMVFCVLGAFAEDCGYQIKVINNGEIAVGIRPGLLGPAGISVTDVTQPTKLYEDGDTSTYMQIEDGLGKVYQVISAAHQYTVESDGLSQYTVGTTFTFSSYGGGVVSWANSELAQYPMTATENGILYDFEIEFGPGVTVSTNNIAGVNESTLSLGYFGSGPLLVLSKTGTETHIIKTNLLYTFSTTSADAEPYAITAASGTATVSRANGWLQSIAMTGPLVLDVAAGSASYLSQVNLTVDAGTNTLSYSVNATNIVTGLSGITATNTTTYLLYSPMFESGWEASEL